MAVRVAMSIVVLLLLQVFKHASHSNAVVCPVAMDTVFLLDGSSSIGVDNFNKLKELIIKVLQHFRISDADSHFGVVLYSTDALIQVSLKDEQNPSSIATKIRNITFIGGNTNTHKGLYKTHEVFTQGGRGHVPRAAVVINDGESNRGNVAQSAQNLKNDDITVISVGIGSGISMNELHQIASSSSHVHSYSSADNLLAHEVDVARFICAVSRQSYVYFTSISDKASMINHVITNVHVIDDLECSLKCLNNQGCFSFDYSEKSQVCQLNYSSRQATPDDVISDDKTIHYDMTFR